MRWIVGFLKSSIGFKVLMAMTGFAMIGFVFFHLLGNLLVFKGPDMLNVYALTLKNLPLKGIWIARIIIGCCFIIHVFLGIVLTLQNWAAKPISYANQNFIKASFSARTMIYSGLGILFFLLLHLAHYTFKILPRTKTVIDALGRDDVYGMVVDAFQKPLYIFSYLIFVFLLGLHLSHGFASLFQTIGINHKKYDIFLNDLPVVVGWLITFGMMSIPLIVKFGL
ncbi:MAG: succinate dehydrogenase cytochrome b subunit [Oligoflexales bacterium]|nr:succinate dehydrogenase cytochrome b subunit [Oligoflexales bacterium]